MGGGASFGGEYGESAWPLGFYTAGIGVLEARELVGGVAPLGFGLGVADPLLEGWQAVGGRWGCWHRQGDFAAWIPEVLALRHPYGGYALFVARCDEWVHREVPILVALALLGADDAVCGDLGAVVRHEFCGHVPAAWRGGAGR